FAVQIPPPPRRTVGARRRAVRHRAPPAFRPWRLPELRGPPRPPSHRTVLAPAVPGSGPARQFHGDRAWSAVFGRRVITPLRRQYFARPPASKAAPRPD